MSDKKTPKDWADQIAEISHSLGEGLFGKKNGKTYKTPNPTVKRREEKPEERKKPGKDVIVRHGPGGDYVKDYKG